ncbi:hypothetical protein C8Q78DRAFT_961890, partial [Trametes maxima]
MAKAVAYQHKKTDPETRVNAFLQKWKISTRRAAGLPEDLRRIVSTAQKYGIVCEARNPAKEIREQMPIWHHISAKEGRSTANTKASKCLRERHGATTLASCTKIAARLKDAKAHKKNAHCKCSDCESDRSAKSCDNPHRCATAARKALDNVTKKWNPGREGNKDGLSLTPRRKEKNAKARQEEGRITFDPSVAVSGPIANAFRVFVRNDDKTSKAALRGVRHHEIPEEETEVYTDGSCDANGDAEAAAGCGVWFGNNDPRNMAVRLPHPDQTNQAAEVYAVTLACRSVPPFAPLHIVSD